MSVSHFMGDGATNTTPVFSSFYPSSAAAGPALQTVFVHVQRASAESSWMIPNVAYPKAGRSLHSTRRARASTRSRRDPGTAPPVARPLWRCGGRRGDERRAALKSAESDVGRGGWTEAQRTHGADVVQQRPGVCGAAHPDAEPDQAASGPRPRPPAASASVGDAGVSARGQQHGPGQQQQLWLRDLAVWRARAQRASVGLGRCVGRDGGHDDDFGRHVGERRLQPRQRHGQRERESTQFGLGRGVVALSHSLLIHLELDIIVQT
ncbi:hypothetical protein L1887_58057 [Cichorium endivia]|nr:hypothetical protein L1887_58057 [Cichorium endivia]